MKPGEIDWDLTESVNRKARRAELLRRYETHFWVIGSLLIGFMIGHFLPR